MTGSREIAKRIARPALYLNKVSAARLGVLMYHRIGDPANPPTVISATPTNFESHVSSLTQRGVIDPLVVLLGLSRHQRLGARKQRFALTFDDGYSDNLLAALPILERYDVPATVFVASGFVGRPTFWWDRLAAIATCPDVSTAAVLEGLVGADVIDRERASTLQSASHERLRAVAWEQLLGNSPALADERLDAIESLIPARTAAVQGRPLTEDELVVLSAHPLITIGAHTYQHSMLTMLSDAAALDDMVTGERRLDELLGRSERLFAYPFGKTSFRLTKVARAAGFRTAVTTKPRWVSPLDHALLIPRRNVADLSAVDFLAMLDR